FRQLGRLEPRERQVRRKRPLFARDAKFFRGTVDFGRQSFQIRRSLDAGPENARAFLVGEKAEPAKINCCGLIGVHAGERTANGTPRSFTRPACDSAICTVPTGFSSLPPPGPAMPVIPTPSVLPTWRRIPSARAIATSLLTAPLDWISSGGTSAHAVFRSLL